jgi:hypothetical protein
MGGPGRQGQPLAEKGQVVDRVTGVVGDAEADDVPVRRGGRYRVVERARLVA